MLQEDCVLSELRCLAQGKNRTKKPAAVGLGRLKGGKARAANPLERDYGINFTSLPDGPVERVTVVKASTFFDGQSALAKLPSGQTDKSQKVSIGALNQETTGTNAASLVEGIVAAAVRAAVKP
jgi:hypothetical protein